MTSAGPILVLRDVSVSYPVARGRAHGLFDAVRSVSFAVERGETVALVGESGCGKTTLARAIVGLATNVRGSISFEGHELVGLARRARRALAADIQMVFQDPAASLHPRMSAEQSVVEGWRAHPGRAPADRKRALGELLERVGISANDRHKYPHEFSGGQRQRISIARALALSPRLLVLDEPVSALDVSIQAQILVLLSELQRERGLAYLLISHDLDVVGQISRRTLAMYLGSLVEVGPTQELLAHPRHPYTEALLAAAPSLDDDSVNGTVLLRGEMPSPIAPPSGCRLRTRCWLAEGICEQVEPQLSPSTAGHLVACHIRTASAG